MTLVPIVAINLYAGCRAFKKSDNNIVFKPKVESGVVALEPASTPRGNSSSYRELDKIYLETGLSVDEILRTYDKDSIEYISGLYVKLHLSGLSDEVIEKELNNIMIMGFTYTDTTYEVWQMLFGNLLTTISEYDNVMDYYYPLAKCYHLSVCDLVHQESVFGDGRVNCANIENALKDLFVDNLSYSEFVIDSVYKSGNDDIILWLENILTSDVDVDKCFLELENVYQMAVVPRCVPDDIWQECFGELCKTVLPDQNVCEVYYELACFVHELSCDFEHYINEYGTRECEASKLVKNI